MFLRLSLQKKKRIESANSHQNVTLFDDDDDDKNAPRGLFSAAGVLFPRRWWCVVCLFLLLLFDVNSIVFLSLSLSPRSVLYYVSAGADNFLSLSLSYETTVHAAEEQPKTTAPAPKHILTDIPDASASVDTTVVFPGFGTDLRFPAAEDITALLGVRNVGDSTIELQAIAGSVNAPQAFQYFVANFSKYEFNGEDEEDEEFAPFNPRIGSEKLATKRGAKKGSAKNLYTSKEQSVVNAGRELTVPYSFQLPAPLAGMDFTLALTAFYQEDGEQYATTFFNHTVRVLDPNVAVDFQLTFVYIALGSFALGLLYLVLRVFGLDAHLPFIGENAIEASKKQKKKTHEINMAAARAEAAKKMSEGGSGATGNDNKKGGGKEDDWLSGTAFTNPSSFSTGATKPKNRKGGKGGKK